jgi:acyl-CoA synthetase (NDP forming)
LSPTPESIRRLLRPRSVAFVGGSIAPNALAECVAAGFDGPIYAVHPARTEIDGRPTYPTVLDLPQPPDAAFVAVNADASVEVVRQLAAVGAGGAVLYAAGFAEAGTAAGVAREEALREAAGDLAVLGPNCYGIVDLVGGVSLWPVPYPHEQRERGVAMVLQSGNLGINVTMSQRSLPLAFLASVGNQAVLDIAQVAGAYLEMEEVTGLGIYLEGLRDVPAFAGAASRALERGIPLAVCKAGSSELGSELAYTHTASLAGSDELYDALFERYGVARCGSIPELLETMKALTGIGPLPGRRAFVFTCSGAECALAADAAEASGVELPQPAPESRVALAEALPEHALVGNPLDYGNALWGREEPLVTVFSAALRDPLDVAMLVIDYPLPGTPYARDVDAAISALDRAASAAGMPAAVASVLPESFPAAAREAALARGIVPLQGLPEAIAALAACARLGERVVAGPPPRYPVPGRAPAGKVALDERGAKELLAGFGLAVPDGRLVTEADPRAVARAAAELGFPVAAKLASPQLPHKSRAGAVALGLRDEAEAANAVGRMLAANPGVELDGVLVERMVTGGMCELLVGARHDPSFGHVLVVGSGGVLVELAGDTVPLLPPIARDDVSAALCRLRVWRRLERADVDAAVDAVLAVARLVEARARDLAEIEINPLVVLGQGAIAVDALCRTGAVSGPPEAG